MFDIGTGEVLALGVLALLVLGPDKLPRYAAEAARFLRQLRTMANDARSEVRRELGPELDGLNLRELNPRAMVRKHVLDGLSLDDDASTGASGSSNGSKTARSAGEVSGAQPAADAPYDPDTT